MTNACHGVALTVSESLAHGRSRPACLSGCAVHLDEDVAASVAVTGRPPRPLITTAMCRSQEALTKRRVSRALVTNTAESEYPEPSELVKRSDRSMADETGAGTAVLE